MLDHHHTTINVDQIGISCIWRFQVVLSDNEPNTLNLKPGYLQHVLLAQRHHRVKFRVCLRTFDGAPDHLIEQGTCVPRTDRRHFQGQTSEAYRR